ncbi:cholesterol 24-hydroxylase [Cladorrhinum sp. PSN332]|nr:cholesterol 24-hydroxylase [Cladorrhinum sp. PSN332]
MALPYQAWASYALGLAGLYLIAKYFGIWIIETITSWYLKTFSSGALPTGKPVSGPKWQFPNGSLIERFIDGRGASEKWQKYGKVYQIWNGPYPEVVITTPEDFKKFALDANDHGKPVNMNLGWYLGQLLSQCMGVLKGQDWVRLRKVFDPTFTHAAAVAQIDVIDAAARKYVQELPKYAPTTKNEKQSSSFSLKVTEAFSKLPYFLTARTMYGPMTEREENELWRITENRSSLSIYFLSGGPYRAKTTAHLFDSGAVRKLREYQADWEVYNTRLVQDRRARGERPPIIKYWEEVEAGNVTLTELLHTLDELLMLNLDVITHVISWFITLLADHEQVKRELREETDSHKSNLLEYLAKTDTHLHRCFVESMRIRPFAVFTPGENSDNVKEFHGVLVKPGTQVLLDVLAINVRNPFWGTNSEAYDPSRLKGIKQSDLRYNLHSFGIGSRKCMGQYVAGHIVKSLIVHLFNDYEVVLESGGQQKGQGYDVDNSSWTPKAAIELRLSPRTPSRG